MLHAESAGHRACLLLRFGVLVAAGAFTVVFLEYWSATGGPGLVALSNRDNTDLAAKIAKQIHDQAYLNPQGYQIIQNRGPNYNIFESDPGSVRIYNGQKENENPYLQPGFNQGSNNNGIHYIPQHQPQVPPKVKVMTHEQQPILPVQRAAPVQNIQQASVIQQNQQQVAVPQQFPVAVQQPVIQQQAVQPAVPQQVMQPVVQLKTPQQCSNPVREIVFLKTHKTGSSTMTNIIMRHADKYNLTVGLPLDGKWELGGYPAPIDKRLIEPAALVNWQVLSHHFRLNIPNMKNIVPGNTKFITIIREPVSNVESAFGFYRDQEPFEQWMPTIAANDRIEKFYENPMNYFKTDTDWFYRAKNQMIFDMGYDVSQDDSNYIQNAINELDGFFDLVLLTDYFDESLVLLKSTMCWDWEDVAYVKFKMRTEEAKSTITQQLSDRIKNWNKADVALYDHFNKTFWRKVDAYGRDRLEADLVTLKDEIKKAENQCIERYEPFKNKPWLLHAKPRRNQSQRCKRLAWSELQYSDRLRDKMFKEVPGLKRSTPEQKQTMLNLFTEVQNSALQHA